MSKITKIDKDFAKDFRAEITPAFAETFKDTYGMTVSMGTITFSPNEMSFKLTLRLPVKGTSKMAKDAGLDAKYKDYATTFGIHAKRLGLDKAMLGKIVTYGAKSYKFVGLIKRRKTFGAIADLKTGKVFKGNIVSIADQLKGNKTVDPKPSTNKGKKIGPIAYEAVKKLCALEEGSFPYEDESQYRKGDLVLTYASTDGFAKKPQDRKYVVAKITQIGTDMIGEPKIRVGDGEFTWRISGAKNLTRKIK